MTIEAYQVEVTTYPLSDGRILKPGYDWIIVNPEDSEGADNVCIVAIRSAPAGTPHFAYFLHGTATRYLTDEESDEIDRRITKIWPPYQWILDHIVKQKFNILGKWVNQDEWDECLRPGYFDPISFKQYWVVRND